MNNANTENKNDRIKWSKEKVIEKIISMKENNEPLNAVSITKNDVKLYGAARTHFGSWAKAVEAAGLDYNEINHKVSEKSWSKDIVVQEIIRFANEDGNLRSDYVQKHYTKLHSAAQRYFKSWKEAIEYAGFNYENIKKIKWSEENIISEILDLRRNNLPLSSSETQKTNMPLFQAACRIFGSWANAVEASGISYKEVKKQKEWEDDNIKDSLLEIKNKYGVLSVTNVIKENASLYQATKRHFPNKSWSEIVKIISE